MFKGRVRNDPAFLVGFIDNRHFCNYDLSKTSASMPASHYLRCNPRSGDRVYRDEDIANDQDRKCLCVPGNSSILNSKRKRIYFLLEKLGFLFPGVKN